MYRDSVGNTYTTLPKKKENKSAKGAHPGPKHGRAHGTVKTKHGPQTGRNGPRSRDRYFGEPGQREAALEAIRVSERAALIKRDTNGPRTPSKSAKVNRG